MEVIGLSCIVERLISASYKSIYQRILRMFETILYQFAIISQLSFALQYLNTHICDTFTELFFELRAWMFKNVQRLQ